MKINRIKFYIDNVLLEAFETTKCLISREMQNEGQISMRTAKVSPQPRQYTAKTKIVLGPVNS